jgi:hypothetical protein
MKKKRFLIFTTAIALAVIVGCYFFVIAKPRSGHLDAGKITAAIHAYSSKMKSENQPLPPTISLKELIAKDFLKHEDVSAFDGWNVTVSLTADEAYPQSILMTATSSKGDKMLVMADGSVQQIAK